MRSERIIVALDLPTVELATAAAKELAPFVGYAKVGLELVTALGAPAAVRIAKDAGLPVFFDGKFHDIPATMAGAVRGIAQLGVDLFTVHASAGRDGLRAAAAEKKNAKMLAVTVLTSLTDEDCRRLYGATVADKVRALAEEALDAGADGLVCSPQEIALVAPLAQKRGALVVTPGVRPTWAGADDQKRVATPSEAIGAGATHLVIGRPLLRPPQGISRTEAAERIVRELEKV